MHSSESLARTDAIWPGFARRAARSIRIVIIDDHPIVREGLGALLMLESDLSIVGDAGDVASGIDLVRKLSPELVICDLTLPGYVGSVAVRTLCRECPTTRVLVLTAHDSLECIRESFGAGAIGYVRKDAQRADLLEAVRSAAAGERTLCRGAVEVVMRNWLRESGQPAIPIEEPTAASLDFANLEHEERRILRMIALGVPTRQIAAELGRGVKAVEKSRANLMRRLDLNSVAAVARFAVSCNILSRQEIDQLVRPD